MKVSLSTIKSFDLFEISDTVKSNRMVGRRRLGATVETKRNSGSARYALSSVSCFFAQNSQAKKRARCIGDTSLLFQHPPHCTSKHELAAKSIQLPKGGTRENSPILLSSSPTLDTAMDFLNKLPEVTYVNSKT
jgi:hypothetical protein